MTTTANQQLATIAFPGRASVPANGRPAAMPENGAAPAGPPAPASASPLVSAGGPGAPLGPNNERLEELWPRLVGALRELVAQFAQESSVARRHEIRRIRQARLFWQGLQYSWWNPQDMRWHLPSEASGLAPASGAAAGGPRYQFVTNIYQAFGLSFISLISQDVPTTRFFPQSTMSEADISAAKAASQVAELIEQNNKVQQLLTGVGFYLWTDGKIGGYVRYVADGQRFGWRDELVLEETWVRLGRDIYLCPACGQENQAPPPSRQAQPPAPEATDAGRSAPPAGAGNFLAGILCEHCGAALSANDFRPAPLVPVPLNVSARRVPNGQEIISIVGGLELNTPVWASEQHEFPYLQWQMEVHSAKLKAAFPHAAAQIAAAGAGCDAAGDLAAREARAAVQQGPRAQPDPAGGATSGDTLFSLVTFSRTWIRPWAFYAVEDQALREQLLQLFPDGCYVAFAGDTYCESRNESMDDHWRVMHALPGDGQNRPSAGDSLIQIQQRYNTLSNIQAETYEYGIPPIYADPQVLDFDALASQTAEPAAHYPARARPGMALADGFFQPLPAQVPPDMLRHQQELAGPIAQFLTGLFPAVFGGEMAGVKTAAGYAMARDQALGRLGLVWRRLKQFYADLMLLGVDCFRKNRPGDVEIPVLGLPAAAGLPGAAGEFQARWIRLADLRGNIQTHAEADETFPRLKSQQRAVLQQLMANPDPTVQATLREPANLGFIKSLIGLNELVIPGEDARNKQLREISQLLASAPIPVSASHPRRARAPEPAGQETGQTAPAGLPGQDANGAGSQNSVHFISTIPVDELLDDHAVELEECRRWASSDAGQLARMQNPAGFANVRAHAAEHAAALARAARSAVPGPGAPPNPA